MHVWLDLFGNFWHDIYAENTDAVQFYQCYLEQLYIRVVAPNMADRLDSHSSSTDSHGVFHPDMIRDAAQN